MIMALLSLVGLIGAPVVAVFMFWQVYVGAPWLIEWRIYRGVIAAIVALSIFNSWLDMCDKILRAINASG